MDLLKYRQNEMKEIKKKHSNKDILEFKNDAEYDKWINGKPGLLELIKSTHDNGKIFIIKIGDNIYRRIVPGQF